MHNITWTQTMFRYHKVLKKGAKGRLKEKYIKAFFVLTAFPILGRLNIFGLVWWCPDTF